MLPALPLWNTIAEHWQAWAVFTIDALLRIGLGVRVILRRQPVPASLTWLVLLLFAPFLGALLYLLMGENRLGGRRAKRLQALSTACEIQALALWERQAAAQTPIPEEYSGFVQLGNTVSGFVPLRGNVLEIMDDANEVLDRLASDIDRAQHHCHLLYYIWMPAGRGVTVAEALIRAAQRGVECRVLVDAVGSKKFLRSPWPQRMRAAGVKVTAALPVNPLRMLFARIDLRNHRKIAVIDGHTAYCGSQNLTDETFRSRKHRKTGPWIDTTVRIVGPAVLPLQTVFLRDWSCEEVEEITRLDPYFPEVPTRGTSLVHVIPSGPGPQPDAIHQALLAMLFSAKQEIIMTTPYFVPDEATKAALLNAALRGVRVTLVVPDVLDAVIVAAASRSHYDELLEAGVRIMHHTEGLLHAKTAVIDQRLAVVTSANLDMRSFWLNFEVSLFIYDDDFAGMLRFLQTRYIDESEQIHLDEWRHRRVGRRFLDNAAQLLGPLL
ncbi:MAG: cardiolipin synthase [Phycisphaerae bacterium]|nr:cardiolipin synthase [Phycisphaerae bacterium]